MTEAPIHCGTVILAGTIVSAQVHDRETVRLLVTATTGTTITGLALWQPRGTPTLSREQRIRDLINAGAKLLRTRHGSYILGNVRTVPADHVLVVHRDRPLDEDAAEREADDQAAALADRHDQLEDCA